MNSLILNTLKVLLSVHLNKDCTNLLAYTSGHRVDPQTHHLVDTDCGYDKMYIFVCVRVIMWLGLKNFRELKA